MQEPALGMLEFKSVAQGIFATDALVKKAPVRILESHAICPGKYMTLFAGEVADVEEALQAGLIAGKDGIINDLFIPYLHQSVIPALTGSTRIAKFGAIGIVETFSVCSCVVAADRAAKAAPIELVEIRLAQGLGGKAYFVMTGDLYNLEASTEAAREYVQREGMLAAIEIIPSPHPELLQKAIYW